MLIRTTGEVTFSFETVLTSFREVDFSNLNEFIYGEDYLDERYLNFVSGISFIFSEYCPVYFE